MGKYLKMTRLIDLSDNQALKVMKGSYPINMFIIFSIVCGSYKIIHTTSDYFVQRKTYISYLISEDVPEWGLDQHRLIPDKKQL